LPEVIEHHGEAVLEQGAVEADVDLLRDLPSNEGVGSPGLVDALHFGVPPEDVPAAESVSGQVLPGVNPVVPGLAPRAAHLEIVEERHVVTKERLVRDTPSRRHGREQTEALASRKDVGAVQAPDELEEVFVLERIIDA